MILYAVVLLDINFQWDEINSVTVFPCKTAQEVLEKSEELTRLYPYNPVTFHSMDLDTGESQELSFSELHATASQQT